MKVDGEHAPFVVHSLGDGGGFTAGCGAEVENVFARLRIEFVNRNECARVLHIKFSFGKTLQRGGRTFGL